MRYLFVLTLAPLAACTVAQSDATADRSPPGECRSESLAEFVGQSANQELGAQMLAKSGARTIRWVPQGGVVTMDFSPSRLTVQLDAANRVETARCG